MDKNYHSNTKENRNKKSSLEKKFKKLTTGKSMFDPSSKNNHEKMLYTKSCVNSPLNTLNNSKDKSTLHLMDLFSKINKEKSKIDR